VSFPPIQQKICSLGDTARAAYVVPDVVEEIR
jgi:hypothetical protein